MLLRKCLNCKISVELTFPVLLWFAAVAGVVVPSKTKIACHFSTLVLTHGQQHTLQIEPRDEYGNPTSNSTSLADEDSYGASVQPVREPGAL